MDRILFDEFYEPGAELDGFQILDSAPSDREGFWMANEVMSAGDFAIIDTTKDLAFKQANGDVGELILGFVAQEVVADNSDLAQKKAMIGEKVALVQAALVTFPIVKGSIATGANLILSNDVGYLGKVKTQGGDTTRTVVGFCTKGNSVADGQITAMIEIPRGIRK